MWIRPLLPIKLGFMAVSRFLCLDLFWHKKEAAASTVCLTGFPCRLLLVFPMTGFCLSFYFHCQNIMFRVVSGLFFHCSSCRHGMPPKRSTRLRNPSARAVAIAAGGEPPRKKSRRAAVQPTPANQGSTSVG